MKSLLPLFLYIFLISAHTCTHDHRVQIKNEHGIQDEHQSLQEFPLKRSLAQSMPVHEPLRIRIAEELLTGDPYTCYRVGDVISADSNGVAVQYTCQQEDVLTASKKEYLIETIMSKAQEYFEKALSVYRSANRLQLGISNCGGAPLTVPVPQSYQNPGYDVDFVLFVTARPILNSQALAYASSCSFNGIGRPIAGHANFNVSNLIDYEGDVPRQLGIAIHEISHALGFSSSRFGYFMRWLDETNWQQIPSSEITAPVDKGDYIIQRIISPKVREAVREHFGCDTLDGADLEDGGSSGTAGSHWEKRLFMNEYMTGVASQTPVFSKITLALFEDSGWYEVNYNVAEDLIWGRNGGCEFVNGNCVQSTSWADYTCSLDDVQRNVAPPQKCTRDYTGYGPCNMRTYSTPIDPPYFQHFPDPNVGGHTIISDFCTYYYPTVSCSLGAENLAGALNLDLKGIADTGQQFVPNSRCFESSLLKFNTKVNFVNDLISSTMAPRCYNHTCVGPNDLRLQVDDVWVKCNDAGADGFLESRFIPGYGGKINCPNAQELCFGATLDRTWPSITRIDPIQGGPSTKITIYGKNFAVTDSITVRVEGPCTNVEVISDEEITCNIPDNDYFVSITDLSIFQSKKDVIVIDGRGYSDAFVGRFAIQVAFSSVYLGSLFNWMKANPLWAAIVIAVFVAPIAIVVYCTVKSCKKPEKPSQHKDKQVHKEDYYDDHFGVDDYYDDI